MQNIQEKSESSLLDLIQKAINMDTFGARQVLIGEVAKKLKKELDVDGEYEPSDYNIDSFKKMIKDKPKYMQVLDSFSEDLIEKIKDNPTKDFEIIILEFIENLVNKKLIKDVNLPLIRRIIYILNSIANNNTKNRKKYFKGEMKDMYVMLAIRSIQDAEIAFLKKEGKELGLEKYSSTDEDFIKTQEREMHKKIDEAVEYICDSEDFNVILNHDKPEDKSGAYLYVIALLAFHEKFKEDKEIRKIGFEKLYYAIKNGEESALHLLWTVERSTIVSSPFLKQIKGEEFELLTAYLGDLIMIQGIPLPIRKSVLLTTMNICIEERDFSRQKLLIQPLVSLYMVGGEFCPLTEAQLSEKAEQWDSANGDDKKQFQQIWTKTKGQKIIARLAAILRFEPDMLDPEPIASSLSEKISKCDSQEEKIIPTLIEFLIDQKFNEAVSSFLLEKIYFILQKLADMPVKELSVQSENNNNNVTSILQETSEQVMARDEQLLYIVRIPGKKDLTVAFGQQIDQAVNFLKEAREELDKKDDAAFIQNLLGAVQLINNFKDFETVVLRFIPMSSPISMPRYIVALLAFQTKFIGDEEIRKFGFDQLLTAIRYGSQEAIEWAKTELHRNDGEFALLEYKLPLFKQLADFYANREQAEVTDGFSTALEYLHYLELEKKDNVQFVETLNYLKGVITTEFKCNENFKVHCLKTLIDIFVSETHPQRQEEVIKVLAAALEEAVLPTVDQAKTILIGSIKLLTNMLMVDDNHPWLSKATFIMAKIAELQLIGLGTENNNDSVDNKQVKYEFHLQQSLAKKTNIEIEQELRLAFENLPFEVEYPKSLAEYEKYLKAYIKMMKDGISLRHCYIFSLLLTEKKAFGWDIGTIYYIAKTNKLHPPEEHYISEIYQNFVNDPELRLRTLLVLLDYFILAASYKKYFDNCLTQLMSYQPKDTEENKLILDFLASAGGEEYSYLLDQEDDVNLIYQQRRLLVALARMCFNNENLTISYLPRFITLFKQFDQLEQKDKGFVKEFFNFLCKNKNLHAQIVQTILTDQPECFTAKFNSKDHLYPYGLVYEMAFSAYVRSDVQTIKTLAENNEPVSCFLYYCCLVKKQDMAEVAEKYLNESVQKQFPLARAMTKVRNEIHKEFDQAWLNAKNKKLFADQIVSFMDQGEFPLLLKDNFVAQVIKEMETLKKQGLVGYKTHVLTMFIRSVLTFSAKSKNIDHQLQKVAYLVDKVLLSFNNQEAQALINTNLWNSTQHANSASNVNTYECN